MRRWQQELLFYSLIAILFTTLFSWFNLNSLAIVLLVAARLSYRPAEALHLAFRNKIFLAYFIFCVIEALGYLHTHNFEEQSKIVSKEATLVAIAFAGSTGAFGEAKTVRRLLNGYYWIVFAASVYCLIIAWQNYGLTKDFGVFFYHSLTRPISQNAVFYSVYVVFGLVFLLSPDSFYPQGRRWLRKSMRSFLILFFLGMIILLNSKLMLVIALLILLHAALRKYSFRRNRRLVLIGASVLLLLIVGFAVTNNPISERYRDMATGDWQVIRQETFNPGMYFNPLQLRMLEWRFAAEVLHTHHAWLFGVSPGDCQDLLDQKYVATHMYIGNPVDGPHRKIRGFIGYNFHNQYLQTFVQSGALGLAALLAIFACLFAGAAEAGKREAWFNVLILAVFFIPEAPLTMQHGVFLFCFFPLLLLNQPVLPRRRDKNP